MGSDERIFIPYRVMGIYCDSVPFAWQKRGSTHFIACSVDRTFHVYNCDKLNPVMIGGNHEAPISSIAMRKFMVFTAAGTDIYSWKRNALNYRIFAHNTPIIFLMVMGDEYLLSVSGVRPAIKVWRVDGLKMVRELEGLDESLEITVVIHPDTYVNKILLGTKQGSLQLWNVNTSKRLFVFEGWGSAVTALAQSTVLDVIAVGLKNGRIVLFNIKFNEVLFVFEQVEGPVSALTFRKDGYQHLVSASRDGTMVIWDLDARRMISSRKHAHEGSVCAMHFFMKEPILLTTGMDNAIKIWIFDQANDNPRILRSRVGHSKIPSKVRFSHMGAYIYSGSQDGGFHMFCINRDQRSREFSQGHLESIARKSSLDLSTNNLKLPPITAISYSIPKIKRWDSILTCHRNTLKAHAWRRDKFIISNKTFKSTEIPPNPITAIELSYSGHYAVIGSSSGWIDVFNMESGLHRGTFPRDIKQEKSDSNIDQYSFHTSSITGLALDITDQVLVSTSLDGWIKFWDFFEHSLIEQICLHSPIIQIEHCKESSLVVLVDDSFVIHVFDIFNKICVRRFIGHTSPISDIALSSDSKWIISASSDSTIRVWDMITGKCINWLLMPSPVVSLSLSPATDFLVTTHTNSRGLFLWANQNYFGQMFLCPFIHEKPLEIHMPNSCPLDGDQASGNSQLPSSTFSDINNKKIQNTHLITLSNTSTSKWKTLIDLDLIIERNRPIDAPKTPKPAPFILKTLPGLENKYFVLGDENCQEVKSTRLNMSQLNITTPLISQLLKENDNFEENKFVSTIEMIQKMTCSALDFEIRSINLDDNSILSAFLNFFTIQLKSNTNYELIQALLNIFLKHQSDVLSQALQSEPEISRLLGSLRDLQDVKWKRLRHLFQFNLCLVNFFLNIPM